MSVSSFRLQIRRPSRPSSFRAALLSCALALAQASLAYAQELPASGAQNPDIALTLDTALAWFSNDQPLQTGAHDPHATGFTLQQAELSLQHAVDPYFRLDAFIVFAHEEVELEEAYATTLALPLDLQLRAGQFLTRFGRLNPTHPHAWDFVDQPLAIGRAFGGEGNRGVGVELSWLAPLPWYTELLGSLSDATDSPSFYGDEPLHVDSPLDFQATAGLRQFFELSDDWSLAFGLSTAHGPNPSGPAARSALYGSDLYLKWRPITEASEVFVALQVELLYRLREVPSHTLHDVGGYAQLVHRFARRWATAVRYEHTSPTWDEHEERALDSLDPSGPGERKRASVSLTFYPSEFSRLRLQGALDLPEHASEPGWAAMLAGEFAIGAHGAHPF